LVNITYTISFERLHDYYTIKSSLKSFHSHIIYILKVVTNLSILLWNNALLDVCVNITITCPTILTPSLPLSSYVITVIVIHSPVAML